jgi:alpha-mannosidase
MRSARLYAIALVIAFPCVSRLIAQVDEPSRTVQQFIAGLPSPFLQGYQESVSGETMGYHSVNEYVKNALLVRATDGKREIKWTTEPVPSHVGDSAVTFAWVAGLAGSKGIHRFDMYIDDRKSLSFYSQVDPAKKVLSFVGSSGEKLIFIVSKSDQFGDLFGYMFLQMPAKLLRPGKSLTIGVVGAPEGSIAWHMTFQHQLKSTVRMEALPLLVAEGDSTFQLIKVGIEQYGPPREISICADSASPIRRTVGWGLATAMLPVPTVSRPAKQQVVIESDGKIVETDTVELLPVHRRVFYLLPHSHTDIGYSDYQTIVEQNHIKYIDEGIRLAQNTNLYPDSARFKWNIEVLWPLESYMRQATARQKGLLVEAVKNGWIGVNGLYANILTGLCRPEELIHATDYARFLAQRYGFAVNTAMISDIPAYTSSTVTALSLAGIKYLSSGPNYMPTNADGGDRIGYALRTWGDKPFYWESQSGQHKVLFWMAGRGYSWFHGLNMGRLGDASLSTICEYLAELDAKSYPYDMVQVRYTMGDNASPDSVLSDCVEAWNKQYVSPKMVIATAQKMFETFEQRYGKQLPVYDGDFTPYWEDGAVSTAKEVATNRNAAEKLVEAETLDAMIDPSGYDSSAFYSAWRNVVLFDEHTWGASNSISEPDSPNVKAQWEYKREIVDRGSEETEALLEKAEKPVASSGRTFYVDVVNTTSWTRTDLVLIPQKYSRSINTVKDPRGNVLASQRLTTGELAVLAKNVPPFAVERLFLSRGKKKNAQPDLRIGNRKIDNGSISVAIDETTGAIKSLVWNHEEFVDTTHGAGLNQYFYVPGMDPGSALTDLLTNVRVKERGPLVASLLIESSPSGTNGFQREIRIVKGLDRVDIIDVIDKQKVREKESVHLGFPFFVPRGVIRMDNGWEVIRPENDQLPGSCKDYFSVQRWVDISNDTRGVTLTNPDAPLVEVGQMTDELPNDEGQRVWRRLIAPAQNIYSYIMNNYWRTNYKADQEGKVTFHYSIIPHDQYDSGRAERAGIEQGEPLLLIPAENRLKDGKSLLSVEPASVIVTSLKPSDDRKGYIVRLYNAGDDLARAVIHWNRGKVRIFMSNVSEEKNGEVRFPILLPKYGVAAVRVDRAR